MAAGPRLDKSKPFITVFGDHEYAFKQGNKTFDLRGTFLGYEGEEPKAEPPDQAEIEMRAKIRAEIEAEMKEREAEPDPKSAAGFRKAKP